MLYAAGTTAAACCLLRHLPTSIVDDLLDDTTNVTVLLGVVVDTQLGRSLVVLGVSGEDTTALSLSSNDPTHCVEVIKVGGGKDLMVRRARDSRLRDGEPHRDSQC